MDLKLDKWYKGQEGILRSVHYRVVAINDNGTVEIVTAKPFERRMTFRLYEIRDEMKSVELP